MDAKKTSMGILLGGKPERITRKSKKAPYSGVWAIPDAIDKSREGY